jgi:hypothetical protein
LKYRRYVNKMVMKIEKMQPYKLNPPETGYGKI